MFVLGFNYGPSVNKRLKLTHASEESSRWQLIAVFLPGKFHGQMSLKGSSLQGHKEAETRGRTEERVAEGQERPPLFSFLLSPHTSSCSFDFTSKPLAILLILWSTYIQIPTTLGTGNSARCYVAACTRGAFGCIYTVGWVPLLSTWKYQIIVNQLYSNTK